MSKTISKTSHQIIICESNFLRLKKIMQNFSKDIYHFETVNPDSTSNPISFKVILRTKYTLLIEAKQKIKLGQIKNFIMRIQISLDAKLAEVISFQGEKAVPHFMKILKTHSKDEKIQQNRFLTEWLESLFLTGISAEYKIKW